MLFCRKSNSELMKTIDIHSDTEDCLIVSSARTQLVQNCAWPRGISVICAARLYKHAAFNTPTELVYNVRCTVEAVY